MENNNKKMKDYIGFRPDTRTNEILSHYENVSKFIKHCIKGKDLRFLYELLQNNFQLTRNFSTSEKKKLEEIEKRLKQ